MILAQPIPNPEIALNKRYLFEINGNHKNPTAAKRRHKKWTFFAPYFVAKPTSRKATKKVAQHFYTSILRH